MKLIVSTVVDTRYQHFLPMFIFCLKNSYPEYQVKIFTRGEFEDKTKKALRLLSEHYDFSIVPNLFIDFCYSKYTPISWRFIVPPEYYKEADYVYVTDIDMMILPEKVSLLNFHLHEMGETGLCYSNSLRNKKHWRGKSSLSGLHFASQGWFEKTEVSRALFEKLLRTGQEGSKREYDGWMLYRMAQGSGLGIPKKYPLVPRHHGIHLGSFRLFSNLNKLFKRIDAQKCEKWINLMRLPLYNELYRLITDDTVKGQLDALNDFCQRPT